MRKTPNINEQGFKLFSLYIQCLQIATYFRI